MEYLCESTQLNENSTQYLLQTFDLAKAYIEDTNCLEGTGITLIDVKRLYDYSAKNKLSKPEPMVADYAGKPGAFVFRHWAEKVIGKRPTAKLFKGFHDTSLKTGSVKGSWTPSPQDMESLICLAYNSTNGLLDNTQKKQLIKASEIVRKLNKGMLMEDDIASSDRAIVYYKQNQAQLDLVADAINKFIGSKVSASPLNKLENSEQATSEWIQFGNFDKKPNNTPKTDIITDNGKFKISLKCGDTGAQLMSGAEHESIATIQTAINSVPETPNIKKLKRILAQDNLFARKGRKDVEEMEPAELAAFRKEAALNTKPLETLLKNMQKTDPEFIEALAYEAMTGNVKFGEKSNSSANTVLVWSLEKPHVNKMYTTADYLKHVFDKMKITIGFKSANNNTFQSLRIITPKEK